MIYDDKYGRGQKDISDMKEHNSITECSLLNEELN